MRIARDLGISAGHRKAPIRDAKCQFVARTHLTKAGHAVPTPIPQTFFVILGGGSSEVSNPTLS